MEESAYNSLMLGVYTFIFITAISLAVYLFTSTVTFADKAYDYGKITTGDSVIETSSAPVYNTLTGAELLTHYYNYTTIGSDKYGTAHIQNYSFPNLATVELNKLYTLTYESVGVDLKPVMKVTYVGSELAITPEPPPAIDMSPTLPVISVYPFVSANVTPGSNLEFKATSSPTYSIITNSIKSYHWTIQYDIAGTTDMRPDFSVTTMGTVGELKATSYGSNLKFLSGTNRISVYSEDSMASPNNSATAVRDITVAYNNPIINTLVESANKVVENGSVAVESVSGVNLTFVATATSQNPPSGYISNYSWSVDGTLVTSTGNSTFNRTYAAGPHVVTLVVQDSISGTATRTFTFLVGNLPAPTITCSNSAITTAHTIAVDTALTSLTFNANSIASYGVVSYVWNIDGTGYTSTVPTGIALNYGIGSHTISVHGVNSYGSVTDTTTLNFTITQNFTPFTGNYAAGNHYTETLPAGKYIFEVWGARGGNGAAGYGGYCKGQLILTTSTTFYIYVGSSAGYNGGGVGRLSYSTGGGATDIRTVSGSLVSRIIVAGGGGGNGGSSTTSGLGGAAGDLTGTTGGALCGGPGTGGTQTTGGTTPRLNTYGGTNGSFGIGGNGESVLPGVQAYRNAVGSTAGAGGGGYYGGGGASCDMPTWNDLDDSGGGGGSSFISGYSGCNSVNISGVHTGQPNHYSGFIFTNTTMTGANNSGNGKATITKVL